MGFHDAVTGKAQKLLGLDPRSAKRTSWESDPRAEYGVPGKDGQSHSLSAVLSEGPNSDDRAHRALYTRAVSEVASHLRELNACLVACSELNVAPFMWAPYRRYLEEKLASPSEKLPTVASNAGRKFFEVAFPAYAPTTVREFSKLRQDKRLRHLRDEILRAQGTAR
jgi:hypothetical protein